jgi:tRNA(fMet)-specific endonuclease VapC
VSRWRTIGGNSTRTRTPYESFPARHGHFDSLLSRQRIVVQRIDGRQSSELAISVMTVDEQLSGWYSMTRKARRPEELARSYENLAEAVVRLARWRILAYSVAAIARVAQWKTQRLNVRHMDLRIAAIALENGATVVTRNVRDFGRVPGLTVEAARTRIKRRCRASLSRTIDSSRSEAEVGRQKGIERGQVRFSLTPV